jgi:hypothetical protein
MFDFDGMMNFSRKDRKRSLVSSDWAYWSVFASRGNAGFFKLCRSSLAIEPMFTVIKLWWPILEW